MRIRLPRGGSCVHNPLAKQLYEAVRAQGYDRMGIHALMLALEQLSNVKR